MNVALLEASNDRSRALCVTMDCRLPTLLLRDLLQYTRPRFCTSPKPMPVSFARQIARYIVTLRLFYYATTAPHIRQDRGSDVIASPFCLAATSDHVGKVTLVRPSHLLHRSSLLPPLQQYRLHQAFAPACLIVHTSDANKESVAAADQHASDI